jgi:haloacetate dehalogenase
VRGMCEDYRAAATIDLKHDRATRAAGIKVRCPTLVLWGANGKIAKWYDALAIWKQYCSGDVIGAPIQSGHYLAEEAPAEVLASFDRFF